MTGASGGTHLSWSAAALAHRRGGSRSHGGAPLWYTGGTHLQAPNRRSEKDILHTARRELLSTLLSSKISCRSAAQDRYCHRRVRKSKGELLSTLLSPDSPRCPGGQRPQRGVTADAAGDKQRPTHGQKPKLK